MPFRPDLQGLRAIAILLVVLAHANVSFLSGGFVGVDVFFVLSGYLITGLLNQELNQTGRIVFSRFYARRLKRLLPALMVMLLISAGGALWLLSDLEARAQLASAPFAASWTSNLYFVLRAVDYFNELASRDIFLHTWSLAVEEQFYLLWPPLLLAIAWLLHRARTNSGRRRIVWLGLGFLLMTSLGLAQDWTLSWPIAAFYLMPARIWQFALGALVYHRLAGIAGATVPTPSGFSPITTCLTFGLGLIMIIGSALLLHPRLAYPGVWALAPSLGAALVITAGHSLSARKGNPLAHPALVWLGDRSYSWYLWHWPILMLGFSLGLEDQPLANLGLILLSLLAALLSYRLVERPFWKGRFSHAMPKRILLLGFLTMAFGIAVLYYLLRGLAPAFTFSASAATIRPADIPVIYQMPCDAWYQHARVEPCVFGSADATKTVVILGDSIGLQWFSMVPALFPAPIWRTVVLTKSSCPMVDENFYYPRIKQVYSICTEWRNAVLAELERLQPDVLIIGSAATYDFTASQWIEGTARVLDRITNKVGNIFLIPGTPSLGFDGPGCVARALSPAGTVDRDACRARDRLALVAPVTDYLRQSVDRYPNSYLLDLNELVCPDGVCQALSSEGLLVFRDSQHLTDRFVRARTPQIGYKLKTLAPDVQFIGSLSAPSTP